MSETINHEDTFFMPMVALRGLVAFPGSFIHFEVGRPQSIEAVNAAMQGNRKLFLVAQKDLSVEEPDVEDLYSIGVVATVKQVLRIPGRGENVRVAVEGITRARLDSLLPDKQFRTSETKFLSAVVTRIKEKGVRAEAKEYAEALVRHTKDVFDEYASICPDGPAPDITLNVMQQKEPGTLADYIAGNIMLEYDRRQEILEILHPLKRLEKMCLILTEECELLGLEAEISEKVQEQIDKNQREYYLREELSAISKELGGGVSQEEELDEFRTKTRALNAPDEVKEKILRECDRLEKSAIQSPEAAVSRNYIETCLELPWGVYSSDNHDLEKSRKILEKDHYGLQKVKERVLESLAVRALAPDIKGQILCLVGPPGVGKTSVAKSIARAMGRKYVRISLGGVKDEAEIRGHRKTYIGSMPGRIIDAMRKAGTANPVMLLDEIDKLSSDYKGDPTSAMLEVLDPEQNNSFRDHYLELPFDLSRVFFITTANVFDNIPEPLRDRMEIIELGSYTHEEKFNIARKHLVPKQVKLHGMTGKNMRITDDALREMIDGYTREAGVRKLEQQIASVCRKCAAKVASGSGKITVRKSDLEGMLGSRKYKNENDSHEDRVGVVNGLAWTAVGGEMLEAEAAVLEGSGKLELTGSLGDVMIESARTAVSCIRALSDRLPVSSTFYKDKDIHIHFPEGAVPKDGPSAGVTIATAVLSALSGRKVKGNVAMTGEITLTGRVLPIGGLKEKSMAAYRAGITNVIIPRSNVPDLDEVDDVVKEKITFIPVSSVESVWEYALVPEEIPGPEKKEEKQVAAPKRQSSRATIAQ